MIVACIDMFLYKFPTSQWAPVRFGSICTRHRDCSGLMAMNHFKNLLGVSLDSALEWIFVQRVAEEIELMLTPGQELDKPDSYMPYMMDMGLSKSSPYSAVRNACWNLFCHSVGSLMQSSRSINGRLIETSDHTNIVANAQLVSFVFETRFQWSKAFVKAGETDKSDSLKNFNASTLGTSDLPSTMVPDDWFAWIKLQGFELPKQILDHCAKNARKLKDARDGSIGQYIHLKLAK